MNQLSDNSPLPDPESNGSDADKQKSSSNRREFITGMGAIKAIRETAQAQLDGLDANWRDGGDDAGAWEQYSKRAMACEFEISFNLHQYRQAASATMLAFQLVDDLEDQLTIYRDHSEVSRLNQQATETPQTVEPGLLRLIRLAQQIHTDTGGAFDITSGQLSQLWGFESRNGSVPPEDEIASRSPTIKLPGKRPNRVGGELALVIQRQQACGWPKFNCATKHLARPELRDKVSFIVESDMVTSSILVPAGQRITFCRQR